MNQSKVKILYSLLIAVLGVIIIVLSLNSKYFLAYGLVVLVLILGSLIKWKNKKKL